ncbi:hypothetical protein PSAB6_410030 [Paraburkholderia sabiae]|nr:hypothetical protein PSAB6_410030 [Paraburkholderia sabiae]
MYVCRSGDRRARCALDKGWNAEVLQYRPFRRVFPPAGAVRMLADTGSDASGPYTGRRGSAFILMPSAAPAAAEEAAETV